MGVIFKVGSGLIFENLKPAIESDTKQEKGKTKGEVITLDSCFRAFNREELLTGTD